MWLIQTEIAVSSHWGSLDDARQISKAYADAGRDSSLFAFLLQFIKKRIEASGLLVSLRKEAEDLLEKSQSPILKPYAMAKLFDSYDLTPHGMRLLLFLDAQSSLIDHFESLVTVLQTAAADGFFQTEIASFLPRPLRVLSKAIVDTRLRGPLRSAGIIERDDGYGPERAEAIEAYTTGDYRACVEHSDVSLSSSPDDIPLLALRTKAIVHLADKIERGDSLREAIETGFEQLYSIGPTPYSAAFTLLTYTQRFYGHTWAAQVRAIVHSELSTESSAFPGPDFKRRYVLDEALSPFTLLISPTDVADTYGADSALANAFPATFAVMKAARGDLNLTLSAPQDSILLARASRYYAKFQLGAANYYEAYGLFIGLIDPSSGIDRLRVRAAASLCCLALGKPDEAARLAVDAYLESPHLPGVLPLGELSSAFKHPDQWPEEICVPLLLELYRSFINEEGLASLRYSFETFISSTGINSPSELVALRDRFGPSRVTMFLNAVWRPEVMRQTLVYESDRDIEEARVSACKTLAELDAANKETHLNEVKERVKQLEISKGTSLIEKSRIHVDIEAIKRSLHKKLSDSYGRYKAAREVTSGKTTNSIGELATSMVEKAKDHPASRILSVIHLLDQPTDAADAQFEALYDEVTNEFLRGDHGLNAYLGTCVKHGTLGNTLRKSVEEQNLVTARDEKGTYLTNQFWRPYAVQLFNAEQWEAVSVALSVFSREFDETVSYLKDTLLQIRVLKGPTPKDAGAALFIYRISNFEQHFVMELDRASSSMDDFVDRCVDLLWEKTDENLIQVQNVIGTEIRDRLLGSFDRLEASVRIHDGLPRGGDLVNAILRARTETQGRINTVMSWFQRSEVYDRQDYAPEFPAQIALNMVRNTLSSASRCQSIEIVQSSSAPPMPGRTLDAMVYIFYDLMANAFLRSHLSADLLCVSVTIDYVDARYRIHVTNNINADAISSEEAKRVDMIRREISEARPSRRAQSDKNSGLHKIWVAVNAPSFVNPAFDFRLRPDGFEVDLSFATVPPSAL